MIEISAKLSGTMVTINNVVFSDEHKEVIDESGEKKFFRYVEMDVINGKYDVTTTVVISADLDFDTLIFEPTLSPWDFIKNPDASTNVPDDQLVDILEENYFEIQKLLKIVFEYELDEQF